MPREYRHLDKTMDAGHLPTPDPASPCGALVATGGNAHVAEWQDCGRPADGIHHMPAHDYRATRCTCGHQLEAVNAR